ncbi:peptide deformylase [Streptomyces sp. AV19]|uniref:peptide deformylase n=1 Tax=Streptomyces sp. AV19 TaxID=2793068 RepID=UPI001F2F8E50|nr:peptide deformylase [Streptomyces sp. AV19]MDG4536351.1 peptide deformylase [Streptomyces sp. AV19]
MGVATPQIGIGRAVAVVRPADPTAAAIVLLNPRIAARSQEMDEQYEGCRRGLGPAAVLVLAAAASSPSRADPRMFSRSVSAIAAKKRQ